MLTTDSLDNTQLLWYKYAVKTQYLHERGIKFMPRMTIEFNDKAEKIIKEIAQDEQMSKIDVIRRALALYDTIHQEVIKKNRKLIIKDQDEKDGRETEILIR